MQVTYASDEPRLFWLLEKCEDPQLSPMPESRWRSFWDLLCIPMVRFRSAPKENYRGTKTITNNFARWPKQRLWKVVNSVFPLRPYVEKLAQHFEKQAQQILWKCVKKSTFLLLMEWIFSIEDIILVQNSPVLWNFVELASSSKNLGINTLFIVK